MDKLRLDASLPIGHWDCKITNARTVHNTETILPTTMYQQILLNIRKRSFLHNVKHRRFQMTQINYFFLLFPDGDNDDGDNDDDDNDNNEDAKRSSLADATMVQNHFI